MIRTVAFQATQRFGFRYGRKRASPFPIFGCRTAPFSVCPYAVSIIRIRQTPKKPGESDDSTEPGIIKRFARTLGACSGLVFGSHKKKEDEEKTTFRTEPYLRDVPGVTKVPKTPSTPSVSKKTVSPAARPAEVAQPAAPVQPATPVRPAAPVEVPQPARPSASAESAEPPKPVVAPDVSVADPSRTEPETAVVETKPEAVPAAEPAPEIRIEAVSVARVEAKAEAHPEATAPRMAPVKEPTKKPGKTVAYASNGWVVFMDPWGTTASATETRVEHKFEARVAPKVDAEPEPRPEARHETHPVAAEPRETPVEEPTQESGKEPADAREIRPIENEVVKATDERLPKVERTSAPAVEKTVDEPAQDEEPEALDPVERLRAALRSEDLEETIVASFGELDIRITRPLGNEMLDLAIASECPLLEVWTRYIVMCGSTERSASSNAWTDMLVADIRNNRLSDLVRHLSYGANPNAKLQMPGEPTAIEVALESGHKPLAEKLLDWGACIPQSAAFKLYRRATARRVAGKTPDKLPDEFMLAAAMGNQALVGEFLALGVNPGARSAQGRTAADFARLAGHAELAAFLEWRFAEYVKAHPEKAALSRNTPVPVKPVRAARTVSALRTVEQPEATRIPGSTRTIEPAAELKPEQKTVPAVEPKPEPKAEPQPYRTREVVAAAASSKPHATVKPVNLDEFEESEESEESDDSDDYGLDDFGLDDLGLDDLIPDAPDSDANRPGTSILTSTRDAQRRHAGESATSPTKRLGDGASGTAEVRTGAEPKVEVAPEPTAAAKPASATTEDEESDDDYRSDNYGRIVHVAPADHSALYERWTVAHWASIGERIFLRALKSLPVDEAVKADFIAIQRGFTVSDADADANGEAFRMLKLYCDDLIDPNTFR